MSTISISNLNINGSNLFCDPESYLYALIEDDMIIHGGAVTVTVSTKFCFKTIPIIDKTIPIPTPPEFEP
jgi:hypothetical protein